MAQCPRLCTLCSEHQLWVPLLPHNSPCFCDDLICCDNQTHILACESSLDQLSLVWLQWEKMHLILRRLGVPEKEHVQGNKAGGETVRVEGDRVWGEKLCVGDGE